MGDNVKSSEHCKECGTSLPINYKGLCPKCGGKKRQINIEVNEIIKISEAFKISTIREFYKKNPRAIVINIVFVIFISIAASVIGNIVVSIITSILAGIISLFLLPPVYTRIMK